jgi:hypothetical protein
LKTALGDPVGLGPGEVGGENARAKYWAYGTVDISHPANKDDVMWVGTRFGVPDPNNPVRANAVINANRFNDGADPSFFDPDFRFAERNLTVTQYVGSGDWDLSSCSICPQWYSAEICGSMTDNCTDIGVLGDLGSAGQRIYFRLNPSNPTVSHTDLMSSSGGSFQLGDTATSFFLKCGYNYPDPVLNPANVGPVDGLPLGPFDPEWEAPMYVDSEDAEGAPDKKDAIKKAIAELPHGFLKTVPGTIKYPVKPLIGDCEHLGLRVPVVSHPGPVMSAEGGWREMFPEVAAEVDDPTCAGDQKAYSAIRCGSDDERDRIYFTGITAKGKAPYSGPPSGLWLREVQLDLLSEKLLGRTTKTILLEGVEGDALHPEKLTDRMGVEHSNPLAGMPRVRMVKVSTLRKDEKRSDMGTEQTLLVDFSHSGKWEAIAIYEACCYEGSACTGHERASHQFDTSNAQSVNQLTLNAAMQGDGGEGGGNFSGGGGAYLWYIADALGGWAAEPRLKFRATATSDGETVDLKAEEFHSLKPSYALFAGSVFPDITEYPMEAITLTPYANNVPSFTVDILQYTVTNAPHPYSTVGERRGGCDTIRWN